MTVGVEEGTGCNDGLRLGGWGDGLKSFYVPHEWGLSGNIIEGPGFPAGEIRAKSGMLRRGGVGVREVKPQHRVGVTKNRWSPE